MGSKMQTATNPETGERAQLVNGAWEPIKTATNPQTGERAEFIGGEWKPMAQALPPIPLAMPQEGGPVPSQHDGRRGGIVNGLRGFADKAGSAAERAEGGGLVNQMGKNLVGAGGFVSNMLSRGAASAVEDPVQAAKATGKALVVDPIVSAGSVQLNLAKSYGHTLHGAGKLLQGDIDGMVESQKKSSDAMFDSALGVVNGYTLGRGGTLTNAAKTVVAKAAPTKAMRDAKLVIYKEARRAGKTRAEVDDAITKARANGDETTFWQALGLDDTATAISTKGGAPARQIEAQATKEIAQQGSEVKKLFSEALKNPKVELSPKRVEAAYKRAAKKEYDAAYTVDFRPSPKMSELLSDVRMQDRLAAAEKATLKSGNAGKASQTEILHNVKQTLDDDVSELFRKGRGNEATALKDNYLTPLLKELDQANPAYAKARKNYAGGNSSKRATEQGEKIFTTNEEDFLDAVSGMAKNEIASVQNGVMRSIRSKMDDPETYNSVKKQFRNPSFKRKLSALMPDADVDKLIKGLDDAGEKFARNSRASAKTSSATAPRQEAVKSLDESLRGPIRQTGAGAAAVATETRKSIIGAAEKLFGKSAEKTLKRVDTKTIQAMSDIMTKPVKDAPAMFGAMPVNRKKRFIAALVNTGATDAKVVTKKLAILQAIEQTDAALTKEIQAARKAINDNAKSTPRRMQSAQ